MRVCRLRSATGNICAHAWHWWSQTATMTTREPMTTQRNYYYCCYYRYCGDYYYDDDDDDDDLALSLLAPVMPCFACWSLFYSPERCPSRKDVHFFCCYRCYCLRCHEGD